MHKTFTTESGSVYEVDWPNMTVRRYAGPGSGPSVRATENWRRFTSLRLNVGEPAVIVWDDDTPPLIPGTNPAAKTTFTSKVLQILP